LNWGPIFQVAVSVLTIIAGIYATRSARRGKEAELMQQAMAAAGAEEVADRTQRFEELKVSLEAARADLDYYTKQLERARSETKDVRTEKEQVQIEWMERHTRLLARCQALADELETVLAGQLTSAHRERIEKALGDIEHHIRDDHGHYDEHPRRRPR
jgi:chromosome segregation ATPase